MAKPPKAELERLYFVDKKSPKVIAESHGVDQRTVRQWMYKYGIKLLGCSHLRKGQPAPWNSGPKAPHIIDAMRQANIGREPVNKGLGNRRFDCEVCGVQVFDKPYRRKRTCSLACRNKLGNLNRGEKHWNYSGSLTREQRKRCWVESREWTKSILSMAHYKCVVCGATSKLQAHHIDGFSDFPEKRLDLENGACLCRSCHLSVHRETSWDHPTRSTFLTWLRKKKSPHAAM